MSSNWLQFLYVLVNMFWLIMPFITEVEFLLVMSPLLGFTLTYTLFNFVESRYFDMSEYQERDLKSFKVFNAISIISLILFVIFSTFDTSRVIYDAVFPYIAGINLLMFAYFFIKTAGKIPQKIQNLA